MSDVGAAYFGGLDLSTGSPAAWYAATPPANEETFV
jgi:hypothetical protein